jgi:hypothetical protein
LFGNLPRLSARRQLFSQVFQLGKLLKTYRKVIKGNNCRLSALSFPGKSK